MLYLLRYNDCLLYELQSKKKLKYLLGIKENKLFKQDYVASLIEPYIDQSGKPRLIEPPNAELKTVQKRTKTLLGRIEVPDNVFSGIKGRSYADNALLHKGDRLRFLFKIDLTAFFPSISRETVYKFFHEDLHCSPDVSQILTSLTTVNLEKASAKNIVEIRQFLDEKNVRCTNHLISGAPTSQILSYLVNHQMFDEMQALADRYGITMSIYVDDVTFSSECRISYRFKKVIYNIIKKYNYQISKKKVKSYSKLYPKLVTGVIINSTGELTIKNSLRKKIILEYEHLCKYPDDTESRQRLKGLLTAARQIDKFAYPTIYRFAFNTLPSEHKSSSP